MYFPKIIFIITVFFYFSNILADEQSSQIKGSPQNKYWQQALNDLEVKKNWVIKQVFVNCLSDTNVNVVETINDWSQISINIKKIQLDYLLERQAILNFEVTNQHINVFIITKDTVQIVNYKINRDILAQQLISLIKPIYETKNPLHLSFNLKLAHQLYHQIFAPLEPYLDNINSLIVIPDDILLGFPYECLIANVDSQRNENKNSVLYDEYSNITFLIHKYAISYNFSMTALGADHRVNRSKKKLGRKLLTMSDIITSSNGIHSSEIDWNLHSPAYGKQEVQRISRWLWRHKNLTGDKATKNYFKKNGSEFRWIYLAVPCLLNNKNPERSTLIFSESTNNKLSVEEIINLNLKADLLTLSGAELKPVQIEKKLGVLTIPQTFLFSGIQSVLFNLWRIHDMTVSRFMSKFYWELKYKRQTNSFALQQAKLASINDTFEFDGQEISKAHPYFWASFILIGNANIRSPTFSTIPPRMVILIVYVLVFIVSLIIVRKTVDRNGISGKLNSNNSKQK